MDLPFQFSLEQEFSLRAFAEQVKDLSREQSQEFLVDLYRQMIIKESMYKQFFKKDLGIESLSPEF